MSLDKNVTVSRNVDENIDLNKYYLKIIMGYKKTQLREII